MDTIKSEDEDLINNINKGQSNNFIKKEFRESFRTPTISLTRKKGRVKGYSSSP